MEKKRNEKTFFGRIGILSEKRRGVTGPFKWINAVAPSKELSDIEPRVFRLLSPQVLACGEILRRARSSAEWKDHLLPHAFGGLKGSFAIALEALSVLRALFASLPYFR